MRDPIQRKFKYTPSGTASVLQTWRRHGFVPTSHMQRCAQQLRTIGDTTHQPVKPEEIPTERNKVTPIKSTSRRKA